MTDIIVTKSASRIVTTRYLFCKSLDVTKKMIGRNIEINKQIMVVIRNTGFKEGKPGSKIVDRNKHRGSMASISICAGRKKKDNQS